MPDAVIQVKELTKTFNDFTAVNSVSFEVCAGEVYGFLGANGAGKTTVIRMLCGLLEPTAGSARVAGFDTAAEPEEVKKRIGYMSQKFSLYANLTAEENISFFAGLYGVEQLARKKAVDEVIARVGLDKERSRVVSAIPGGIRQRVALAAALVHSPHIIFLDEPTAGVDPVLRRRFWEIIRAESARGRCVFVTTHYMDEVEHCGRIALMNEGRIVREGAPSLLKRNAFKEQVYEMETEDAPAAFKKSKELCGEKAEISLHGASLHIVPKAGEKINDIADSLRKAGINVSAPTAVEPTMEDVFVKTIKT